VLYHTERNSDVYVASLDQKAAFDSMRFTSLFLKLGRLGFTGPIFRLLVATYKELKAIVRVSGLVSQTIDVKRTVRQGGVLSTFLYLVYINDLLDELESCGYGSKVMSVCTGNPAFADDISLLALTPFHLQRLVDIVHTFFLHWKVSVNVDKVKYHSIH